MRYIQLFLILILVCSCNVTNDEVYYTFNGITIKRIDTNGESAFYYLKDGVETEKIWAEYSGINEGFDGYLKFEKNGTVSLLSGDGYFQTKGNDTILFNYKRIYSDGTNYNIPNVCEICYPIEAEKEWNKKTVTKIKIKYVSR